MSIVPNLFEIISVGGVEFFGGEGAVKNCYKKFSFAIMQSICVSSPVIGQTVKEDLAREWPLVLEEHNLL